MSLLESQTKAVVVTLYTSLFPWFCCFTDFSRPRMSLFSVSVFSSCSFLLNVLRLLSYSSPQLLFLLLVVLERESMSKKLLMRERKETGCALSSSHSLAKQEQGFWNHKALEFPRVFKESACSMNLFSRESEGHCSNFFSYYMTSSLTRDRRYLPQRPQPQGQQREADFSCCYFIKRM